MSNSTNGTTSVPQMVNIDIYTSYGYTPSQKSLYAAHNKNTANVEVQCQPIFDITFSNKQMVTWGPSASQTTCLIPDQAEGSPSHSVAEYQTSKSVVSDTVADWNEKISGSFSGSFSGVGDDFTGSGSIKVSGKYSSSIFENTDSDYFVNYYIKTLLQISMNQQSLMTSRTSGFQSDIDGLPADLTQPGNKSQYLDFLAKYGTHYLSSAVLGGTISMQTSVTKTLFKTQTKSSVKGKIDGAFSAGLDKGSVGLKASYSSGQFFSDYSDDVTVSMIEEGDASSNKQQWGEGLYNTPFLVYKVPGITLPIYSTFLQVSSLTTNSTIQENLKAMIKVYLREPLFDNDNIISEPIIINASKIGTASENLMLTAYAEQLTPLATAQLKPTGTAMNSPVRTSLNYVAGTRNLTLCGLAYPVSTNDEYGFSLDVASGAGTVSGRGEAYAFQNLPKGQAEQLSSVTIALNGDSNNYTPASDGFIMAQVYWDNSAGASGSIQLLNSSNTAVSGASQHYFDNTAGGNSIDVPVNSFCFPVKAGSTYTIKTTTTAASPTFSASFMPLPSNLQLGAMQPISNSSFGNPIPSDTDGFLVAYIDASGNNGAGCMAQVKLKSCSQNGEMVTRNGCSADYQLTENTNVPYNSALLPVPKTWNYEVEVTNNVNNAATVSAFWIPLTETAD